MNLKALGLTTYSLFSVMAQLNISQVLDDVLNKKTVIVKGDYRCYHCDCSLGGCLGKRSMFLL